MGTTPDMLTVKLLRLLKWNRTRTMSRPSALLNYNTSYRVRKAIYASDKGEMDSYGRVGNGRKVVWRVATHSDQTCLWVWLSPRSVSGYTSASRVNVRRP